MPLTTGRGGVATTFNEYDEAIGINPANLGYSTFGFSISALNAGFQLSSETLSLTKLSKIFTDPEAKFSDAEKQDLMGLFTSDNGLNFKSHVRYISGSVLIPIVGSFAFSLEGYSSAHVALNNDAADIIFNGQNADVFTSGRYQNETAGQILDGTRIMYSQFRAANIAYGRKIGSFGGVSELKLIDLYGGVGYRYIWGMGHLDLDASNGTFSGLSSFSSNKSIDYGSLQNFDPKEPDNIFNASGTGHAFDFGLNATIAKIFRVGVSVINVGTMTWQDNVLTATDTNLRVPSNNDGAENYEFQEQAELFYGQEGIFNFSPDESYETKLPSVLRVGGSVKATAILQLGADYSVPLNEADGSFDASMFSFAAEINVALVKIATGYTYNKQYGGHSIPFGFQINVGVTQMGIGIGDVISLVNGEDYPNASLAVGALRFNF